MFSELQFSLTLLTASSIFSFDMLHMYSWKLLKHNVISWVKSKITFIVILCATDFSSSFCFKTVILSLHKKNSLKYICSCYLPRTISTLYWHLCSVSLDIVSDIWHIAHDNSINGFYHIGVASMIQNVCLVSFGILKIMIRCNVICSKNKYLSYLECFNFCYPFWIFKEETICITPCSLIFVRIFRQFFLTFQLLIKLYLWVSVFLLEWY